MYNFVRCVGLPFVALKCSFKALGALTLRSVVPGLWPILQIVGLASVPIRRSGADGALRLVAHLLGTPVLLLMCVDVYLRVRHPGAYRTITLWERMLPIYCAYIFLRWKTRRALAEGKMTAQEVDERWAALHEWGGEKVYNMVLEASGYVVKVAQVLASKHDVVPEPWTRRLSPLFDSMPPRAWKQIKKALEREVPNSRIACEVARAGFVGSVLEELFETIEMESLASASIAQVHCARISQASATALGTGWESGDRVVLKVQHSTMKGLMDVDLNTSDAMAEFMKNVLPFELHGIIEELKTAVPLEFDFLREARMAEAIRKRLAGSEFDGRILVPRSATGLCTQKLLAQEFMEGEPFSKLLPQIDASPVVLKTMREGLEMIIKAYGKMMIYDGLFHGDPHPGNILLRSDGKFVLLDFGQCKAMVFERQIAMAHMMIALSKGDTGPIVMAMLELGVTFMGLHQLPPDPEKIAKMAVIMFDTRYIPEANVNPFGDAEGHILSVIKFNHFPPDLWFVTRVMMLLRGLCSRLHVDVNAADLWLPYAQAVLQDLAAAKERSAENHKLDVGES